MQMITSFEASFTNMSLNNARSSRTCFIVLPQTKWHSVFFFFTSMYLYQRTSW